MAGQMGSVFLFNGARYLLAGLAVFPFALCATKNLNTPFRIRRDQWVWMGAAGAVLFGAAAFQQLGLRYTSAGNAGFITSLYVVFVPFALYFFWKERPHWLAMVAVVLAGAGAFLLSSSGTGLRLQPGDALELIGAFLWTFHVLLVGKFAWKFEPISFSVGQLIICGLLNLGLSVFFEAPNIAGLSTLVVPILYTALLSLGLGYTLQVWAQRHTPPADAALILSLESVFAVLAGWIMLNETLTPIQIFGCTLIFLAVLLSQAKPRVSV
jgi:drug/metabolite transporter (DMT)-like permease